METVRHLSCSVLHKKLTAYSRKQFSQKVPPYMIEWVLNNTKFYFDESYSHQLLTAPLNL